MTAFEKTERNRVRRVPERGIYNRAAIYRIIDEALICHVGFVQDGQPFVIPTLHVRRDDDILLHGATTSRLIRHIQTGNDVCIAFALLDGLVLARSAFHHSVNYRSVVLFGKGVLIVSDEEKLRALEDLTNKLMPGRWEDVRKPNAKEHKATAVVSIAIESASAKTRTGSPGDDDEDYQLPVWAGVLPLKQQFGAPEDDPRLSDGIPVPEYILRYIDEPGT